MHTHSRIVPSKFLFAFISLLLLISGCSSTPEVRFYSFPTELPSTSLPTSGPNIGIENFVGDTVYSDNRMVYRVSPYRLDYYYYHRWASIPSQLLSDYVRSKFILSGRFSRVELGFSAAADVVLSGRIVALEQVEYEGTWHARVGIDFALRPNEGNTVLWSQTVVKEVDMRDHQPESYAAAAAEATNQIVAEILPIVEKYAKQRMTNKSDTAASNTTLKMNIAKNLIQ